MFNYMVDKEKQRFSLRKLSIGVASVLLGTTIYFCLNATAVHADTVVSQASNMAQATPVQSTPSAVSKTPTQLTIDVTQWQGQVVSNKDIDGATRQYYQLTGYTGNNDQIVVPNGADFQKAGVNTGGYQVGVTSQFMYDLSHRDQNAKSIAFSNTDSQQIKALNGDWGNSTQKNFQGVFEGENLISFDGRGLDTTNVVDMRNLFQNNRLSDVSTLANWNTGNVQNFENMFNNNQLNDISPLTNWNTSNVVNMGSMFKNNQLTKVPKNNWDTSSVTDMSTMFASNQLNDLAGLSTWNTSKVAHMAFMFQVNKIDDLSPLTNWNTGSVASMQSMFNGNQIKNLNPLATWDLSHVTSTSGMFNSNVLNDISGAKNWNVGNIVNMSGMFLHNQLTNLTPLANWQTGNVTDMSSMFGENRINQLNGLEKWDTSRVKDTHYMFGENWVGNLIPLKDWNVSQVTNMNYMFGENWLGNLNGTENWDVRNVKDMGSMFQLNHLSDISALKNWQTDSLQSARYMFNNDQVSDLSALKDWKLNNAENLESMFRHNFISDVSALSGWNTDKVTNFNAMFQDNQIRNLLPLANWQVNQATNFSNMFANNQIALADFRKWIFKPNMNVNHMLQQPDYHVVVLINTKDMSHDDVMHVISSDAFNDVKTNQIYLNDEATSVGIMYGTDDLTSSAVDLLRKLISEDREKTINANLRLYHSQSHNTVSLVAPDPTGDDYTVPVVMANQKYRAVFSNQVSYQLIDDDNGSQLVKTVVINGEDGSRQVTGLVVPKDYVLAKGQELPSEVTIPVGDQTVQIYLQHTQHQVVINYVSLTGQTVSSQTITGKWGQEQSVGLQVPDDYVLYAENVPSKVIIEKTDGEIDLLVASLLVHRSYRTSNDSDLHTIITRTISVVDPRDHQVHITARETLQFGRDSWTDKKTGKVTYSDWVPLTTNAFSWYFAPRIDGYYQSIFPPFTVMPVSDQPYDYSEVLTYQPLPKAVHHPYIDVNGRTYDTIPTGYHVVAGQSAKDGAMLVVKDIKQVVPKIEYVTRTIIVKMPNDRTRTIKQKVMKGRSFTAAHLPKLKGYTTKISEDVDHAGIGAYIADHDVTLTVEFVK